MPSAQPVTLVWELDEGLAPRLWIDAPQAGELVLTATLVLGPHRETLTTTARSFLGVGYVEPPLPTEWLHDDAERFVTDYHLTVSLGRHTASAPPLYLAWPDGPTGPLVAHTRAALDGAVANGVLDASLRAGMEPGVRLLPSPDAELPPPVRPSEVSDTGVAR